MVDFPPALADSPPALAEVEDNHRPLKSRLLIFTVYFYVLIFKFTLLFSTLKYTGITF
jgi:hypothetical protein